MLTKRLLRLSRPSQQLLLSSSSSTTVSSAASQQHSLRALSSTTIRRAATHDHDAHGGDAHGGHHDSHYNAPGGWLWGQRPGEKYEKEGWENLFYWGFCGSWVVAIIAYAMKEDTSIQTWALEEARRRLEKEGILEDSSK